MLLIKNFVGTFECDTKYAQNTVFYHINRLANLNMLNWTEIQDMKYQLLPYIHMKFVTITDKHVEAHKDSYNNMLLEGFEEAGLEELKSLQVSYEMPPNLNNTYNIQDLIASELIIYPYKVNSKCPAITLEAIVCNHDKNVT